MGGFIMVTTEFIKTVYVSNSPARMSAFCLKGYCKWMVISCVKMWWSSRGTKSSKTVFLIRIK